MDEGHIWYIHDLVIQLFSKHFQFCFFPCFCGKVFGIVSPKIGTFAVLVDISDPFAAPIPIMINTFNTGGVIGPDLDPVCLFLAATALRVSIN